VRRIAREISSLGVHVEDEDRLHRERSRPYAPFGPEGQTQQEPVAGIADISGEADVVELKVDGDAPVVEAGDIVTLLSRSGLTSEMLQPLSAEG
jgi:hypothetical protein